MKYLYGNSYHFDQLSFILKLDHAQNKLKGERYAHNSFMF